MPRTIKLKERVQCCDFKVMGFDLAKPNTKKYDSTSIYEIIEEVLNTNWNNDYYNKFIDIKGGSVWEI